MFSRTLYAQQPVIKNLHNISPRFSPTMFNREGNSVLLLAHHCTAVFTGSMRRKPQNPVFTIIHDESVKVYLHIMYNGNVQQNPLCVESCVTKEFSISPRLWRTIFDPDANSVTLCAENPVFEIVQENVKACTTGMSSRTLHAQYPVSLRIFPSLPGYRLRFFIAKRIQYSY